MCPFAWKFEGSSGDGHVQKGTHATSAKCWRVAPDICSFSGAFLASYQSHSRLWAGIEVYLPFFYTASTSQRGRQSGEMHFQWSFAVICCVYIQLCLSRSGVGFLVFSEISLFSLSRMETLKTAVVFSIKTGKHIFHLSGVADEGGKPFKEKQVQTLTFFVSIDRGRFGTHEK